MQGKVELKGSAIIRIADFRIRHPFGHLHSDIEALNLRMYPVIISLHSLLLVLREHCNKVAHVSEKHEQLVRSLGHNALLTAYFHHVLFVLSPCRRSYPPLLENFLIALLDVSDLSSHLDQGIIVREGRKFHIRVLEGLACLVEVI